MSANYQQMTNPEAVAAVARLEGDEREKALASLGTARRTAVEDVLASHPESVGARAAVLERLGREKQIRDAQAYTADGISPNTPLVTKAVEGQFTEAAAPEAAIDKMVGDTAAKGGGGGAVLAAAGKDTSKTLSSDEATERPGATQKSNESDESDESAGTALRGKLPDGFPGKAALEAEGHTTYAKVRALHEKGTLTDVPGIAEATAAKIAEALEE
jgi:hypothetical protein